MREFRSGSLAVAAMPLMQTAVGAVAPQVRGLFLRNALVLCPGAILHDRRRVLRRHAGVIAGLQLVPARLRRLGLGGGLAEILGCWRSDVALGWRKSGPTRTR